MTPIDILNDIKNKRVYTLNTGGDCIISVKRHANQTKYWYVWDYFTGEHTEKKPAIIQDFHMRIEYLNTTFDLLEFN